MRRDSGDLHHALDTRLSLCDLTTPDGLARFLKATEHGLAPLAATQAPSAPLAADLVARLHADLATLGHDPLPPATPLRADLSPWAVDYVVLGSRLGTSVLARQWQAATDAGVRAADRYFSAPPQPRAWRDFCGQTGNMSPIGETADRAMDDILDIFQLFYAGTVLVTSDFTAHQDGAPPTKDP